MQKYCNYDITILNFKTISDKSITITINIIILYSPTQYHYNLTLVTIK